MVRTMYPANAKSVEIKHLTIRTTVEKTSASPAGQMGEQGKKQAATMKGYGTLQFPFSSTAAEGKTAIEGGE